MSPGMTLFAVQAILILGTEDGARIFAKYFSPPHAAPTGTQLPMSSWKLWGEIRNRTRLRPLMV